MLLVFEMQLLYRQSKKKIFWTSKVFNKVHTENSSLFVKHSYIKYVQLGFDGERSGTNKQIW